MNKILEYFCKGFFGLFLIASLVLFGILMISLATFPVYVFNEFNFVLSIFSAIFCWSGLLGIIMGMSDNFHG